MSKNRAGNIRADNSSLVYSTEVGRTCPRCRKAQAECSCKTSNSKKGDQQAAPPTSDGIVRLHRERSGRKGKGVTLIKGLTIPDADILALAKKLKSSCGVGGAVKSGIIELQTAEREKIKSLLDAAGFTVKLAGG